LVDQQDPVDLVDSFDEIVTAGRLAPETEVPPDRSIEDLLEDRRLAASGNTGESHQEAERDAHVLALQIVLAGPVDREKSTPGRHPPLGRGDRALPRQER